jgi:hypothetical protein
MTYDDDTAAGHRTSERDDSVTGGPDRRPRWCEQVDAAVARSEGSEWRLEAAYDDHRWTYR